MNLVRKEYKYFGKPIRIALKDDNALTVDAFFGRLCRKLYFFMYQQLTHFRYICVHLWNFIDVFVV